MNQSSVYYFVLLFATRKWVKKASAEHAKQQAQNNLFPKKTGGDEESVREEREREKRKDHSRVLYWTI